MRIAGFFFLFALLAVGGYVGWQKFVVSTTGAQSPRIRLERPVDVVTARVAMRDFETIVEAVGSSRARRSIEITPLASGRVTEIAIRAGAWVKAGDVLLRLDDDIQRADLSEAEAQLSQAQGALDRARTLKKNRVVAASSVDKLIAARTVAEADRARAARRLSDRTVIAPFAGIVGFTEVEQGARIENGSRVASLDDLSMVDIEFWLSEDLFGTVVPGRRIVANAAAFPDRTFTGAIDSIASRVDPVSRAFRVRARVANPDFALPAGMFMHLSVVLDVRQALTVPEEAVVIDGGRTVAFAVIAREGKSRVEQRVVVLGKRTFGHVEVRDGLTAGDEVIIRGVQKVRDGRWVRVRPSEAAGPSPETEPESKVLSGAVTP